MAKSRVVEVVAANALDFACDALILKYAQNFHGADLEAAKRLGLGGFWDGPKPGEFRDIKPTSPSKIKAGLLLFAGTPPISYISYATIRELGRSSMKQLNIVSPNVKHIAMTVHGVNFGLDEKETFLANIAGVLEALSDETVLVELEKISIVELRQDRAVRLSQLLADNKAIQSATRQSAMPAPIAQAGLPDSRKAHVFVAMPFTDDMEDVFIFGIQGPVQEAGLLCERVDMDVFTGDILDRIKSRIESACLVIADLSGANANVYLEVGFAWGRSRKTLLLCRSADELKFDVRGQRCVLYTSIRDLNKKLTEELKILTK